LAARIEPSRLRPTATCNQLRIEVSDRIHLSEIRDSDKSAFVQHLNDRDIYDRTLRIPYPCGEEDAQKFLEIVSEATAKHGHPVNDVIRPQVMD